MNKKDLDVNDVLIGKKSNMPTFAYIADYGDSTSNAELGAKVREAYENYQQYVEANRETWKREGAELREIRKTMDISQCAMSQLIGVNPNTFAKMEKGEPVRSRKMMKQACKTAIKFIDAQRQLALRQLESTPKPK